MGTPVLVQKKTRLVDKLRPYRPSQRCELIDLREGDRFHLREPDGELVANHPSAWFLAVSDPYINEAGMLTIRALPVSLDMADA